MPETAISELPDDSMKYSLMGLLALFAAGHLAAQPVSVHPPESEMLAGITLVLEQNYESATEIFRSLSDRWPEHPMPYLLQAGVLQAVAMDYESRIPRASFDSLLALAEELSEDYCERYPGDARGHFYLGTVHGYHSFADAVEDDWFGAASSAMSSVSEFEAALERDSSMEDAKLGIGTYYYWKSRQLEFLTWVPFVGDDRAEGIALIESTIERGTLNRHAAMSSLISIFLDAGEYARAVALSEKALADYPNNRLFLWGLATSHDRLGHTNEAIGAYRRLLDAISSDARDNAYNELVCRVNLARLEALAGQRANARATLAPIAGRSPSSYAEHLHERAERKLAEAKELGVALAGS